MNWIDIASIVFACVTANHLGLVKAAESVLKRNIPIVDCPKCGSFWLTLIFQTVTNCNLLTSLAISFLASYLAIWLELLEGYIDTLYLRLYEKIYPNSEDDTTTSVGYKSDTDSTVS